MTFRTRRQNAIRRRQIELMEGHGRRKISATTTTTREDRAGAINAISPQRFSRNPLLHYLPYSFAFISGATVSGVFAIGQIRVFNTYSFRKKKSSSYFRLLSERTGRKFGSKVLRRSI